MLRTEAHNILIRTSLSACDNTHPKHVQRVIQSSMTLKGNAGFMEQCFRSFHLKQMNNILKHEDSKTVLGLY